MSRRISYSRLLAAAAGVCAPLPALAQAIDYAQFGEMMGEPVTTSVTGKPQRASEAPASIVIITRADIARSPARDVPGLLKSYAGIDVNRGTAGQTDVSVRGGVQINNSRLLVMVNGRQVYLDQYGYTNWNLLGIQLDEIQQIELVRGPASALFGFNAASGVVNIITVDAMKNRLNVSADAGSHGISRVSAVAGLAIGEKAGLRITAGRAREDQRHIPDALFDPQYHAKVRRDEVSGTFDATPGDRNAISINAGYAHNHQVEFLAGAEINQTHTTTRTVNGSVAHDTGWGSIGARAYANWLTYGAPAVSPGPGRPDFGPLALRNRVLVGQGSVLARLGTGTTVRFGGEYRGNRLTGNVLYSRELSYDVFAGSIMIDTHPSDRLSFTAAARVDRKMLQQEGSPASPIVDAAASFPQHTTAVSFNGAVLVKVGQDGQIRLNGGRGIQSPSLLALGVHSTANLPFVPFPLVVAGNPAVRAPRIWSGEIGYARPLGQHVKFDASIYADKIQDFIAFININPVFTVGPTGQPALVGRVSNIGDLITYGTELSLTGTFGRWTGLMNYSWTHSDDHKLAPTAVTQYQTNAKQATAEHKANAQISYDAGRWFGTLTGRYTSATSQLGFAKTGQVVAVRIPITLALDAKLAWRITPTTTLSVAGENLTKARGAAGSSIWADRRLWAGISVAL